MFLSQFLSRFAVFPLCFSAAAAVKRSRPPSPIDTTAVFHTRRAARPLSLSHSPLYLILFQLLLGCGGSPLFTLGTTYVDNHVKRDDSSMYIGIMYSMCAFGPVCGFLLGAYLLSHHVDTFTIDVAQMLIGENSDSDCFVSTWQKKPK